jgi:tRNA-splicing ligase RtcB
MQTRRIDEYRLMLPRSGAMKTSALVYASEQLSLERGALKQLCDAASIDAEAVVLATPDIHLGYGVPIGSVLASPELVSPAAVGYDINCGMRLMLTPYAADELPARRLADEIRRELPLGEGKRNRLLALGAAQLDQVLERGVTGLLRVAESSRELAAVLDPERIAADVMRIEDRGSLDGGPGAVSDRAHERGASQLGTLGGGNHFVEIQRVGAIGDRAAASALGLQPDRAVVMIHSGSRGLGHQVADEHMRRAASAAKRLGLFVPNKQLAYVPAASDEGRDYLAAMRAAANFAFANRQAIAALVRRAAARVMGGPVAMPLVYDVSHNIATLERHQGRSLHVHRKGATRAFPGSRMRGTELAGTGQPVLIPGSMGTASHVLLGTESAAESLYSVNHGAGRTMSRTAAAGKIRRRDGKVLKPGRITDRRFKETMRGVYLVCEDARTIKEEAPDAYKDIDVVVETVVGAGLARQVARLEPLAVLKG